MADRGLLEQAGKFGLGIVVDPPDRMKFNEGMLAIPYVRKGLTGRRSVASIRFRCIACPDDNHQGHGKYVYSPGDHPRLFNTAALQKSTDWIAVTEGELDAVAAATQDIPAVGMPGVTSFKPHFSAVFEGYRDVYLLSDGDAPGRKFGETLVEFIPQLKAIHLPDGYDVNSFVLDGGDLHELIERGK